MIKVDKKYYLNMDVSNFNDSIWVDTRRNTYEPELNNDYTYWYPSDNYQYNYGWTDSNESNETQKIINGVLKGIKEMVLEITKEQVRKIEQARKIIFQKAPNCPECGADTRELEWNSEFFVCNYCDAKIYPVVKD